MKKIILIYVGLIFLCFLLPAILTKPFTKEIASKDVEDKIEYEKTIKLLHTATGEIEQLNLEEYLYGVVSAEMPVSYEMEALKAQAIVARTYTIYKQINDKEKHGEADICDDSNCCQAWISKESRLAKWEADRKDEYWNKIMQAVDGTKGKIITYEGQPINAFFHSNSGGLTEAPIDVWGGSGYPYLQTVSTSGEEEYLQYSSEVILSKNELINRIKENHPDVAINFDNPNWIEVKEHTEGGRVKTINIGNVTMSGVEARKTFGLKSANFSVTQDGDNIRFSVIGYGHGVGMSQTGADSLAKEGKTCEEIIKHFYTGVEVTII